MIYCCAAFNGFGVLLAMAILLRSGLLPRIIDSDYGIGKLTPEE
jgi:hypothetical protein